MKVIKRCSDATTGASLESFTWFKAGCGIRLASAIKFASHTTTAPNGCRSSSILEKGFVSCLLGDFYMRWWVCTMGRRHGDNMKHCVSKGVNLQCWCFFPGKIQVDHFLINPWISHDVSFPQGTDHVDICGSHMPNREQPLQCKRSHRYLWRGCLIIFDCAATSTWGGEAVDRWAGWVGSQLHLVHFCCCLNETQVWPVELDLEAHFLWFKNDISPRNTS